MDTEFTDRLSQLRQAMAAPASEGLVAAHVAAIDEAILALQGMRDGFKGCAEALEVEKAKSEVKEAQSRIVVINLELKDMGGEQQWHNMYSSIPKDAVHSKEYFANLDEMQRNLDEILRKERMLEEQRARLLSAFPTVHDHNILSLNHALTTIQNEKDNIKGRMLLYLEPRWPFDAAPYLSKKRALLDEKLELLKRVRRAEGRAAQ